MEITEFVVAVLIAVAGGAAGAALINGIVERWKFQANRKATKEDKAEAKADKTKEIEGTIAAFKESEAEKNQEIEDNLSRLETQSLAQSEALKVILLDRILWLGQGYINKGEISYDDRRRYHEMYESYHNGLGGNGDADIIVSAVDELRLKK